MATLIGAEYLIGNAFIALGGNRERIYFGQLRDYGVHVKEHCASNGIDVVLLLSTNSLEKAVFDFSDYFSCHYDEEKSDRYITLQESVDSDALQERFLSALPTDVLFALLENALKIAA